MQCIRNSEFWELVIDFGNGFIHLISKPFYRLKICFIGWFVFFFQPWMSLKAFQILVASFFLATLNLHQKKSFPAAELNKIPLLLHLHHIFYQFYWVWRISERFRHFSMLGSLTIPVKYTFLKGTSPLNSNPAIIILATQRK